MSSLAVKRWAAVVAQTPYKLALPVKMYSRFLLTLAATLLVAASAFAADKSTVSSKDSRAAVIADGEGAGGVEFIDDCHVKVGESDKVSPIIPMLVAAHSLQPKNQAAIRVAIDTSLRQGCDISEVDLGGLQPLNAAILFADPVMVKFLLEKGADPYQAIKRPDNPTLNDLNSFDFIEIVKKKREERSEKEILKQYVQIEKYLEQRR